MRDSTGQRIVTENDVWTAPEGVCGRWGTCSVAAGLGWIASNRCGSCVAGPVADVFTSPGADAPMRPSAQIAQTELDGSLFD